MAEPWLIAIVGGECSGKSTLTQRLRTTLPAVGVHEVLREWVVEHQRTPRQAEQWQVMRQQQSAEANGVATARQQGLAYVVADASVLMTAVYSDIYFDDPTLYPAAVNWAGHYRLIVHTAPDFPWQAETGVRDGPQWREQADTALTRFLPQLATPVVRVAGDLDSRVSRVQAALVQLSGRRPDEPLTR